MKFTPDGNTNCEVCTEMKSKYRCPKCQTQYCSAKCFKEHPCKSKQTPKPVEPQANVIKSDFIQDQELRLSQNRLRKLRQSQKIKDLLKQARLRQMLKEVDDSKCRSKSLQIMLRDQTFQDFADEVLKVLQVVGEDGTIK